MESECKRCLSEVWEHGCTASCEDKGEAERIKLRRFNQGFMTEQEVRDWNVQWIVTGKQY